MSWEYWLANHTKKELFYLGKGQWSALDGFNSNHAEVTEYEDPKDLVSDMIELDLVDEKETLSFLFKLAQEILEFCGEDEVQIIMDSDEYIKTMEEYTETKDITLIT